MKNLSIEGLKILQYELINNGKFDVKYLTIIWPNCSVLNHYIKNEKYRAYYFEYLRFPDFHHKKVEKFLQSSSEFRNYLTEFSERLKKMKVTLM